jgi:hypothetical protein
MSEKKVRPQQQSLRFSIVEPEVCRRIEIQVDLEPVAADERNAAGWIGHIRWRLGESREDLLERLWESLLDLYRPRHVWTDNRMVRPGRRKGTDADARR